MQVINYVLILGLGGRLIIVHYIIFVSYINITYIYLYLSNTLKFDKTK